MLLILSSHLLSNDLRGIITSYNLSKGIEVFKPAYSNANANEAFLVYSCGPFNDVFDGLGDVSDDIYDIMKQFEDELLYSYSYVLNTNIYSIPDFSYTWQDYTNSTCFRSFRNIDFDHPDLNFVGVGRVRRSDGNTGGRQQEINDKPRNDWVNEIEIGTKITLNQVTITALELIGPDEAREFLNAQESMFEDKATFFSRLSYALGLLATKAHWGVGTTIATVGYVGGEAYGDIANRYDSIEAFVGSIHHEGVYLHTIDTTTRSIRNTFNYRIIKVYTYDGQLIGEIGY